MFLGEFEHSIDQKGRITIPARFRTGLAEGMVITRGLDSCLWVFPKAEWTELAQKISSLPLTNVSARDFARLMFSGAAEVAPDSQGRVLVPNYLRAYAHLDTEAVVIGLNWRMEIWNRSLWKERRENVEADADAIGQQMADLDLGI